MFSVSSPCAIVARLPPSEPSDVAPAAARNALREMCFMTLWSFSCGSGRFEPCGFRPIGQPGFGHDLLRPSPRCREQALCVGECRQFVIANDLAAIDEN